MRAARLVESAQKNLIGGIKKKNLHPVSCRTHLGQDLRPGLKEVASPEIDPERDPLDPFLIALAQINKFGDQKDREVINAEETVILEGPNGDALSRTRKSGDDDDVQTISHKSAFSSQQSAFSFFGPFLLTAERLFKTSGLLL
jgi:hypothetical protein